MHGSSRHRERSTSVSAFDTPGQPSREIARVPVPADISGDSIASSSARQEQIREAELAAEQALRQYQAETQPTSAPFPCQVHRQPAPQQSLRHVSGTVGSSSQLQRIPEVISEGSSGEAASKSARAKQNAATMPQALRAGGPSQSAAHNRGASMEEYSRALPRNFDPITGRKEDSKQTSRRPSLPYVFEPLSTAQPQRGDFPNPHQSNQGPSDSQLSTAQLQRRASRGMQSPLLSHNPSSFGPGQRNNRLPGVQARPSEFDIPPTPPLGQRSGLQTMPLSINKARPAQVATAASPQAESTSSAWSSSTESEPTPTASSIAAMRERNAQLESQLLPVHLTLPSRFFSSSTLAPVQSTRVLGTGASSNAPVQQERRAIPPVTVSEAEVASIKASAAPFAPTTPSKLSAPPIRSNPNDTSYSGETVALPDGTQIPTVRTDFQNLKRISLPRPAAIAENASSFTAKEQLPGVGGHVLSRADPRVVPKNDGSSRTIYSPTPQTLAAARKQSTLLQVPKTGGQGETMSDARIPSPLSASAEAPAAPQIPHSLQFDKLTPSTGASPLNEVRQLPATTATQKGRETQHDTQRDTSDKSVYGTTQAKSDDTDVRKRNDVASTGFQHDPRRNTFGELAPSMLEEANKKLFLYQMQQLDEEAREKGVGSSRQPAQSTSLAPPAEVDSHEATERKVEPAAAATTTSVVRRESSASQRSRRDSIGSATTAFDSPTKEEFPATVHRQTSGSGSAKAIRRTARETVAPPSDVQEVQEPDEAEVLRSADDDDGTEIDEHESAYDLSLDKRVPFVVDTHTNNGYEDDEARQLKDGRERSEFRFIPISSVKAGKARRPRTRDTRVSFRSNPSRIEQRPGSRQHGANPTCRQCFRAGFDCAMNLQLGEGTAARKAFQDFVAAAGLNAFSIRDGTAAQGGQYPNTGSLGGGSITVEEALGRNYVDKLGEVAFGESALSRPVTRGMYNELLEEKQEQERRKHFLADYKSWSADVDDEIDLVKSQQQQQRQSTERVKRSLSNSHKDRRLSQMTLQDGVDNDQIDAQGADARQVLLSNIKRSGSHKHRHLEEGEVFDFDPADYEDEGDCEDEERHRNDDDEMSSASSDSDLVAWADRWNAWVKVRQLFLYWVIVFALQALASGYTNTVTRIIVDERASEAVAILLQLGSLSYNGSQGGGLFFANLLVGYGRQRITLIALVAVAVVCAIAGFMHHWIAILACQSVLGLLSGLFVFLALATVMDLFATSKGRLFGAGSIALVLIGGQLSGPWISKLVLKLLSWSWTYWLTIIVAAVLVVYDGIATRETTAFVLFRRHALRVKRTGQGWAPEPQSETKINQAFSDDLARPVRLMRRNPMLIVLALAIAALAGMYMFLFSGLQGVFVRVHGLSNTSAALAVTVSAAIGLIVGIFATYLVNSKKGSRNNASGFATKIRPLYLDEKGHIDTRRPLRAKTESLLVPGIFATAVFSFALYTLALTSSFATTWFLTAFSIVLATASLTAVGVSTVQYVMDGYSPPRRVMLRDVVAREEVSTPTLLQNEDEDRFTSYSRRTAGRLVAGASRFKGCLGGRHGRAERERLHRNDEHDQSEGDDAREAWLDAGESVTTQRDKRWLDESALAATTAVVSLLFTVCSVLSFVSYQASAKLSFGAFSVIFASVVLVVLLIMLCVYLYGAKPRARSLTILDEADAERAHGRRARLREKRALQRRRTLSQSQATTSNSQAAANVQNRARSAPLRMMKRFVDALGYKPLSDDALDVYRRDNSGMVPAIAGIPTQRRVRTPAPPMMREAEAQSTATAAAEGRRELWLAKLIASRDKTRPSDPVGGVRTAPAIQLNEATEARPSNTTGSALKQSMKEFGGVMLGRPAAVTTITDTAERDPIGRTLNASTSLPVNLHSTSGGVYPASPPPRNQAQHYPLTPPPRAQPPASISHISPPAPAKPLDDERPYTPVMTRKSVDMTSRTGIMARSHSQPLGLYAAGGSPSVSSPRRGGVAVTAAEGRFVNF